jgi:chromosome segregation ATPase
MRIQSAAGRHAHDGNMTETVQGATSVVRRLQEELQRITTAFEAEQHTRAILQGKLDALDSHHQASIKTAVEKERAKCAREIEALNQTIATRQATLQHISAELNEREETTRELEADISRQEQETVDMEHAVSLHRHNTQTFVSENDTLRATLLQHTSKRQALAQALDAALKQEQEVQRSCTRMTTEADQLLLRLQSQLADETKARMAAQNALNGLQVQINETAKPLPSASGIDLEKPLCVCVNVLWSSARA